MRRSRGRWVSVRGLVRRRALRLVLLWLIEMEWGQRSATASDEWEEKGKEKKYVSAEVKRRKEKGSRHRGMGRSGMCRKRSDEIEEEEDDTVAFNSEGEGSGDGEDEDTCPSPHRKKPCGASSAPGPATDRRTAQVQDGRSAV